MHTLGKFTINYKADFEDCGTCSRPKGRKMSNGSKITLGVETFAKGSYSHRITPFTVAVYTQLENTTMSSSRCKSMSFITS